MPLCVCVCVCVYTYGEVHMCLWVYRWRPKDNFRGHPCVLRQDLLLVWDSPSRLDCLTRQGSICLCLPHARLGSMYNHACFVSFSLYHVCVQAHVPQCIDGGPRTMCRSQFSFSTRGSRKVLRSSDLMASDLTC